MYFINCKEHTYMYDIRFSSQKCMIWYQILISLFRQWTHAQSVDFYIHKTINIDQKEIIDSQTTLSYNR